MRTESILKNGSIREIVKLMIKNKYLGNKILKVLDARAYKEIVIGNPGNRLIKVQEEKYLQVMALAQGFSRAFERGLVSGHIIDRLIDVFLTNVLLNKKDEGQYAGERYDGTFPLFILISPTGKCNLRCTGCYAESNPENHASLDFETFNRILTEKRDLWNSHFTVISGGEPFLWHDGSRGLLDVVERHPDDMFMVYTNATLITDDVARRMSELGNITPAISVEGFEKETDNRRGKGVHRKILRAFEDLRRHGVPFGISATPTTYNWEIIVSDRFADFYFEREGAVYGWLFQYMPIGRGQSFELMVTPVQRIEMLKRMQFLVRERKIFLADFWNSGVLSNGCICAGRPGGYFYIDWNGDITPCAFVPYVSDNIHDIYSRGGTVNDALDSPFFREIREWQNMYGFNRASGDTNNWLCPCVIRDHFEVLKDAVSRYGPRPLNDEAAEAMHDECYQRGMKRYGEDIGKLTDPIWKERYLEKLEKEA